MPFALGTGYSPFSFLAFGPRRTREQTQLGKFGTKSSAYGASRQHAPSCTPFMFNRSTTTTTTVTITSRLPSIYRHRWRRVREKDQQQSAKQGIERRDVDIERASRPCTGSGAPAWPSWPPSRWRMPSPSSSPGLGPDSHLRPHHRRLLDPSPPRRRRQPPASRGTRPPAAAS